MKILFAYAGVVLIWATTPLAIQWSSDSLSFIAAALLRMVFALALGLIINALMRRKLFAIPGVWQVYAVGALGIFPNMPVVYWSAQYIPSGVVAIIFAMSPFVTGLLSALILKQNPFSPRRLFALLLAVAGLVVIFYQQLTFSRQAVYGGLGILLSCFIFGLSSVLVKKVSERLHVNTDAFNQTLGSLLFSLPGLLVAWLLLDGHIPDVVSSKSWMAVSYLAILGSLLGITLYFYVLANMSATAVSLITLITPVLALLIGVVLAGEIMSWPLLIGALLVVIALLIYLNVSFEEYLLRALRGGAWHENSLEEIKNNFHRFK
ncbi:MAG TPA: DMT family transporter [Cellvibrio sp.]|nr:DMT family transporter [Cellvibrio sp.]